MWDWALEYPPKVSSTVLYTASDFEYYLQFADIVYDGVEVEGEDSEPFQVTWEEWAMHVMSLVEEHKGNGTRRLSSSDGQGEVLMEGNPLSYSRRQLQNQPTSSFDVTYDPLSFDFKLLSQSPGLYLTINGGFNPASFDVSTSAGQYRHITLKNAPLRIFNFNIDMQSGNGNVAVLLDNAGLANRIRLSLEDNDQINSQMKDEIRNRIFNMGTHRHHWTYIYNTGSIKKHHVLKSEITDVKHFNTYGTNLRLTNKVTESIEIGETPAHDANVCYSEYSHTITNTRRVCKRVYSRRDRRTYTRCWNNRYSRDIYKRTCRVIAIPKKEWKKFDLRMTAKLEGLSGGPLSTPQVLLDIDLLEGCGDVCDQE